MRTKKKLNEYILKCPYEVGDLVVCKSCINPYFVDCGSVGEITKIDEKNCNVRFFNDSYAVFDKFNNHEWIKVYDDSLLWYWEVLDKYSNMVTFQFCYKCNYQQIKSHLNIIEFPYISFNPIYSLGCVINKDPIF